MFTAKSFANLYKCGPELGIHFKLKFQTAYSEITFVFL